MGDLSVGAPRAGTLLIILPFSQCPVGTYAILLDFLEQRLSTGSDSLITKLKTDAILAKTRRSENGRLVHGSPLGQV